LDVPVLLNHFLLRNDAQVHDVVGVVGVEVLHALDHDLDVDSAVFPLEPVLLRALHLLDHVRIENLELFLLKSFNLGHQLLLRENLFFV